MSQGKNMQQIKDHLKKVSGPTNRISNCFKTYGSDCEKFKQKIEGIKELNNFRKLEKIFEDRFKQTLIIKKQDLNLDLDEINEEEFLIKLTESIINTLNEKMPNPLDKSIEKKIKKYIDYVFKMEIKKQNEYVNDGFSLFKKLSVVDSLIDFLNLNLIPLLIENKNKKQIKKIIDPLLFILYENKKHEYFSKDKLYIKSRIFTLIKLMVEQNKAHSEKYIETYLEKITFQLLSFHKKFEESANDIRQDQSLLSDEILKIVKITIEMNLEKEKIEEFLKILNEKLNFKRNDFFEEKRWIDDSLEIIEYLILTTKKIDLEMLTELLNELQHISFGTSDIKRLEAMYSLFEF